MYAKVDSLQIVQDNMNTAQEEHSKEVRSISLHIGIMGNEQVDEAAKMAAERYDIMDGHIFQKTQSNICSRKTKISNKNHITNLIDLITRTKIISEL